MVNTNIHNRIVICPRRNIAIFVSAFLARINVTNVCTKRQNAAYYWIHQHADRLGFGVHCAGSIEY